MVGGVLDANFSFAPTEPKVSGDIQFFDETTRGCPPYSFEWDFNNDGIIDSPEANPTWHYTDSGNYTVSLEVNDIKGNTDTVEKKIIVCPAPAIEVNKTVFNETTSQWVNVTTAHINDIMRFRCEVHNNGTCNLMNITVTDILSDSLEYRDNATVDAAPREPDWIAGNQFVWNFTGLLMPCETITIEFDTRVVKCGNDTNTLNATAWCDETGIFVSDVVKAYVNVPVPTPTPTPTTVNETQYLNSISQPVDSSKIRFTLYAVNEEWVKDSKWQERPMKLTYWQKSTKYSIAIDIDEHGYVTRVDFMRWGFPITEIPYDLAVRSLNMLNP